MAVLSWFVLSVGNKVGLGSLDLDAVFRPHGSVKSWWYISSSPLKTYNTFRVRYFNTFGGTATTRSTPLPHQSTNGRYLHSRRARSDPLGACHNRFLLGEESKVILEQFELGALRESTLPRHYLVIYFGEFLPTKESSVRNIKC